MKIAHNVPSVNKHGYHRNLVGSIYGMSSMKEMSNIHREHSIDASYEVSVHLAKQFQRRRFKKIGHSETRIACGGHVW
jgi:hypothetical protein